MKAPAGLCDKNFTWFANDGEVWCIYHGRAVPFEKAPYAIKHFFMMEMAKDKEFMTITGGIINDATLEQYILKYHSRLSNVPDIDLDTLKTCRDSDYGLTRRELEVAKEVSIGLPDKISSERLGMSKHTYRVHISHINQKLNLHSKVEITKFSYEHDIV